MSLLDDINGVVPLQTARTRDEYSKRKADEARLERLKNIEEIKKNKVIPPVDEEFEEKLRNNHEIFDESYSGTTYTDEELVNKVKTVFERWEEDSDYDLLFAYVNGVMDEKLIWKALREQGVLMQDLTVLQRVNVTRLYKEMCKGTDLSHPDNRKLVFWENEDEDKED